MKIGDYVRTKYGISKCIKVTPIRENSFMYEFDREVYEDVVYLTASELEKYKSNSNIIDLIEVGDVISIKEDIDNYKKIYILGIPDLIIYDEIIDKIKNDNIRLIGIVTKEQFESMEYKIYE